MYSGVIIIDGNRVRFRVDDWKTLLAIKTLRNRLRQIMLQSFRSPGRELLPEQQAWLEVFGKIFSRGADNMLEHSVGRAIVGK